jgi:hypothetical protein
MGLINRPVAPVPAKGTASESLAKLLNLFYGLAISTGFGMSLRMQVTVPSTLSPLAALVISLTFLIALCDWVIFHFAVAPWAHRGLVRLLLDLAFPIGLFVLTLKLGDLPVLMLFLAGYFALSVLYALLARWERLPIPWWNIPIGIIEVALCVLTGIRMGCSNMSPATGATLLAVVAGLWTIPWSLWLRSQLRQT